MVLRKAREGVGNGAEIRRVSVVPHDGVWPRTAAVSTFRCLITSEPPVGEVRVGVILSSPVLISDASAVSTEHGYCDHQTTAELVADVIDARCKADGQTSSTQSRQT